MKPFLWHTYHLLPLPKSLNGTGRRWWLIVETEREKTHRFLLADSLVWHDLLQSVTTAVSSLFLSPLPKSTVRFLRHDEVGGGGGVVAGQILFPPPSIECQVVYWLPVFWLASSWANLTAGRWIVLNDESVCFQKVFSPFCSTWKMDELVEKPTAKWRGCAGGERCQGGARLY